MTQQVLPIMQEPVAVPPTAEQIVDDRQRPGSVCAEKQGSKFQKLSILGSSSLLTASLLTWYRNNDNIKLESHMNEPV